MTVVINEVKTSEWEGRHEYQTKLHVIMILADIYLPVEVLDRV